MYTCDFIASSTIADIIRNDTIICEMPLIDKMHFINGLFLFNSCIN